MIKATPCLGLRVGFFRFSDIKMKTLDRVNPISYIRLANIYTCREEFTQRFARRLAEEKSNCVPLAAYEIGDKVITQPGTITLKTTTDGQRKRLMDKRRRIQLGLTFDYILGILGVCVSRGKDEILRRESDRLARANSVSFKTSKLFDSPVLITYRTLSPFWMSSTPLMSLFLGLARNCFSATIDDDVDLDKYLFRRIDKKTIFDIINNVDYEAAKDVYYNIIQAFYDDNEIAESSDLILKPDWRRSFDKMVERGYQKVFDPYNTSKYWEDEEDPYAHGWQYHCNK